jgi:hypothetical protein
MYLLSLTENRLNSSAFLSRIPGSIWPHHPILSFFLMKALALQYNTPRAADAS